LVDYLSVRGNLQGLIDLSGAASLPHSAEMQGRLEVELIRRLVETPRIGSTVVALGRAPKGADLALLADLLGTKPQDTQEYYDSIAHLSFVKLRNKRIFLHDELYAMLTRQVYASPEDALGRAAAESAIHAYYKNQIRLCRQELSDLFGPIERRQGGRLDSGCSQTAAAASRMSNAPSSARFT
jgi:hypothetical protein